MRLLIPPLVCLHGKKSKLKGGKYCSLCRVYQKRTKPRNISTFPLFCLSQSLHSNPSTCFVWPSAPSFRPPSRCLGTQDRSPVSCFFRQSAPYKLSANLLTPTLPCLSSLIPSLLPVRLSSLSSLRMSSLPASLPACELSPTLLFFINFLFPACLTSSFPYHTAALFLLICLL